MRAKREAGKGGRSLRSLRSAQRGRTLFRRAGLPCAFPPSRRKNEVKQLKLCFYTLGCKVNQNETGALAELFCQNGFSLAREGEAADVYLVNSCTVTAGGDKKSRQWLRRAKRLHPGAVTVLAGCYPQAFPEEAAAVAEADIVMGAKGRRRVLENVLSFLQTHERIVDIAPHEKGEAFEELPLERFEGHTRAFMKIEDGCNRRCAYCVIPRARGYVRSRSEENILKELAVLAGAGYKEVVFSGINLSSYGQDTGTTLAALCEKAAGVPGIERIRLGSLEPDLMDGESIRRMAAVPQMCPQFHLSLQSGCTETLRRMRRVYTARQYAEVAEKLRAAFPRAVFTTDVIVGFPGETQAEFEESMAFVRKVGFLKVHVFSYSRREGTPAYDMPGQIDEHTKALRSHTLQAAADEVRAQVISAMAGTEAEVLLEREVANGIFTGYTKEYVPVRMRAPGRRTGDIVRAVLGAFDGARCAARPV